MGRALIVLVAVTLGSGIWGLSNLAPHPNPTQPNPTEEMRRKALERCERGIAFRLIRPLTMKVVRVHEPDWDEDSQLYVLGVYSQDFYGTPVRSTWFCRVRDGEVISLRGV